MSIIMFLVKFFSEAGHAEDFLNGRVRARPYLTSKFWNPVMTLAVRTGMRAPLHGCSREVKNGCG